ncbi:MAG: AbrB/MazE/SpoVT family DNA-binding domain-containing protein [Cyanobacteria bacterium SW_12_48_29]|jgi:antitoxin MazE|nr:MAG: AbrB/MazE/SpoVT family DNA-binding domain-containing protein [Cyanobacteria bacterium QH_7_48_89]PSO66626.1 MAG: AbrB/MazE/SpoVT family DNA-binding domain-containing protein [Cyanobacteria bacterium QH_2_48_84]PSO97291.1 MAG: AbrB/MazE/SpoVT family DNA-binding domain-containing protein [Cyanobacteria bacterium SW_12_48_29]PSP26293.1 MAG: AbrB/MazE/SpoVT family DNA-binding domain-containing protein [Cyanobacteria bacterium SW_8_48_13]
MTTSIKKWGNSLGVRIPQSLLEKVNLKEESRVDFEILDDHTLKIIPQTKGKYSLDDLLEGVTPEHFNGEMDWGEPVGEEVW